MVAIIIKSDGRKEPFIREKIVVSAVKAGATLDLARTISSEIEKLPEQEIKSIQIEETVLEKLSGEEPTWKENWLLYDRAVKRR